MSLPSVAPAQVASALERYYTFPPAKARALAAAGPGDIRSPWSIPGMEALAERLAAALRRGEPILVFGDFDADGVTGSAVLLRALAAHSQRILRYTPIYGEGYGLRPDQVERFAARGARLVVTVDSGITSHRAVARARALGLEVLITDHHLPRPDLGPPPCLWIDPPDHLLSGAQLAYLLAQAVREDMTGDGSHDPWGLALSAVGAQADFVPVDEAETRAWVALAHATINSPDCPRGLQVLREMLGERYTTSEMRSLAGLLNMGKRSLLVNPAEIVEALLPETADERRREVYHFLLQERSRTARLGEVLVSQALEDARAEAGKAGLFVYELGTPAEGLAEIEGPLTSRLVEVTGRPVLVLRPAGEQLNFSGRARSDFSFESFLSDPEVRAVVLDMGGHRQAIGGSIARADRTAFLEAVRRWEQRQPPVAAPSVARRAPQVLGRLDPALAHLLGRAVGPFGHRLRPLLHRAVLDVKGGWAYAGDDLVELDRPLEDGDWQVTFRFDEAGCDGKGIALRVVEATPA